MQRIQATLILLALTLAASAQVTTSQISGVVRDSSGASAAQIEVRVINQQTLLTRSTVTNAEGFYIVSNLPPGEYRVHIEHTGFKTFERSNIVTSSGDRVDVSPTLALGHMTEVVSVVAHGEQVETESGTVGRLVDGDQVRELALDGRNLFQMVMLLPGVSATTDQFDRGGIATGSIADFNFNGTRATSTSVMVDGGSNQDSGNITGQTNNVSVDFVQEVKVASSSYSAEYGRNAGAQINFTTRSGTEQYHGTLFEFFRNDKLNARGFFSPTVDVLRLNQFGWNLGGQVWIPGLLKKGDRKIFFFVGQEYRRRIDGQTQRTTFPTVAQRSGNIGGTAVLRYPPNFPVTSLRGQLIQDPVMRVEPVEIRGEFPIAVEDCGAVLLKRDGRHPDGHPLRAFRALVQLLTRQGEALTNRQVFITGAYAGVLHLSIGKSIRVGFGDLGVLDVEFRASV